MNPGEEYRRQRHAWLAKRIQRLGQLQANFHAEMMRMKEGRDHVSPLDFYENQRYTTDLFGIVLKLRDAADELKKVVKRLEDWEQRPK